MQKQWQNNGVEMTPERAKEIMKSRGNVKYKGHDYRLRHILYGFHRNGNLIVSAELEDINGASSIIRTKISEIEEIK